MEIKKILIANRGEIALRIIRTCKEMGIKTAALCPERGDEENFLETEFADEFYYLESEGIYGYLDQIKIVQIAKNAKVDAIHPGYGFLAENGDFADLCARNNIKFIGPNGDTLRKLGNKIEAKKIARQVGCPLLPSTEKPVKDEKECLEMAKRIGTPFLLKASNGGGGVGIQAVYTLKKDELSAIYQKLKREAKNAYNNDEIFIEKFLPRPRHIEFQIIGDGRGKVIHLAERECSVQRRHQKLIEEAPSPFIDKNLRKKMGDLAVKFGKYLKYENVGTIEFLIDQNKKFYFIEVNPRLQVEHPVTELIHGIDIVEQQIRIARGESFNLQQKDDNFPGWAMEFRINAEEAKDNFRPAIGTIAHYFPPGGKGIEVHSFCKPGQKVFPHFDSLLAKLVVFGKDRATAIKRAKRAFDEFSIKGVPTLIPFFKAVLENQNFINGNLSTSFIEEQNLIETLRLKTEIKSETDLIKKSGKNFEKKEIAAIVANLYRQIEKQNPEKYSKTNKWLMAERIKMMEPES